MENVADILWCWIRSRLYSNHHGVKLVPKYLWLRNVGRCFSTTCSNVLCFEETQSIGGELEKFQIGVENWSVGILGV